VRCLADENVPRPLVSGLIAAGHDVTRVLAEDPERDDDQVLARARREGRVLLTFDRDFGDLVFRGRRPSPPGIIYLRDRASSPLDLAERLILLFERPDLDIAASFITVTNDDIRRRPLPV
jgi:predicted nuclease of predicted toxin-antitoxin system